MLDYIALYPETIAMVRRYPAADRALLYEAMVVYGTEGTDPDWPEDDLKWLIWESLRQRVEAAARKSETNRANRRQKSATAENEAERNETNDNETERTATNDNEAQRNETNRNPETETETETDPDTEIAAVTPEAETHTNKRQQGRRGRAREGWFDPENPDGPDDEAWRGSDQARKAVAQRIAEYAYSKLWRQNRYTEAGILGSELFAALEAAMREGIPPGDLTRMISGCLASWVYEAAVKEAVIDTGGTANYPDWVAQLQEIKTELQEIRGDQRAYG